MMSLFVLFCLLCELYIYLKPSSWDMFVLFILFLHSLDIFPTTIKMTAFFVFLFSGVYLRRLGCTLFTINKKL